MPFTCVLLTQSKGVYMGSGIGSLDDVYDTTVAYEKGVSDDHLSCGTDLTI